MNRNYKLGLLAAAMACVLSAHATGNSNNSDNITNNYDQRNYGGNTTNAGGQGYGGAGGQGGAGGSGGIGIGGAGGSVLGSGNSTVKNDNTNMQGQGQGQLQGQQQGQGQNQGQGQSQAASSNQAQSSQNTNNIGATGSGNSTKTDLQSNMRSGDLTVNMGDTHVQEAAQAATAYAPAIPTVATSCRLYISLGGAGSSTSTTASASGGIPIGNDETCLIGNALRYMSAVNQEDKAQGRKPTFTAEDFRQRVCKLEGMDSMSGCKATPPAQAPASGKVAQASDEPSDPFVRSRMGLPPLSK